MKLNKYLLLLFTLVSISLPLCAGKKIKLVAAIGRVKIMLGSSELSNKIIAQVTKLSKNNEVDEDQVSLIISKALNSNNVVPQSSNNNNAIQDDYEKQLALALQESLKITKKTGKDSKQEMSDAEFAQSLQKKDQRAYEALDTQLAQRLQEKFDEEVAHKSQEKTPYAYATLPRPRKTSSKEETHTSSSSIKNGVIVRAYSSNNNNETSQFKFDPASIRLVANTQHEGNSCGYHAFANAQAIQYLADKKEPVTQENIQAQAKKYLHIIKPYEASSNDLEKLGQTYSIGNLYILHLDDNGNVKPAYQTNYSCSVKESEIAGFRTRKDAQLHCICNTGGHWILVSLIKKAGNPRLIFLDSGNGNLEAGSTNYKFVEYLYRLTIK